MHIAVIQGSPRLESNSFRVAQFLSQRLNIRQGVNTSFVNLRELSFPNFDDHGELDEVHQLQKALLSADGILFVFPEYNGGMPGAMKNALDYFRSEYNLKPMAATTVSAGPFGGLNAWHAFYSWALYVGGILLPNNLKVSNVSSLFNEKGEPVEKHFRSNYPKFLDEFCWLIEKLTAD
ncbi:MAG: NAD(P)H-dependent oxidoreductase [Bacteroidota bacterium]|nr:NAD(P)H-dependent oxidoreductase [Bacteroidota bacterium]